MAIIDKKEVIIIRGEVNKAMKEIAERHSLKYDGGSGSWTSDSFKLNVTFNSIFKDGQIRSEEVVGFERYCWRYNLKPSDLGREFVRNGIMYRIVGLLRRNPKFPIIVVEVETGKRFKYKSNEILSWLSEEYNRVDSDGNREDNENR